MPELTLPRVLDLSAAAPLLAQLQAAADLDEDCRLIAKDVGLVGTACLQTLLAFDQALNDRGHRLTMVEPSPILQDSMSLLGMETVLTRWTVKA